MSDVATATEHVLATRDWLDPDRVAVFGGSYGGYAAYWTTVQYPDLFDAGIAWIGLTDLEATYETTMPRFRTEPVGNPSTPRPRARRSTASACRSPTPRTPTARS